MSREIELSKGKVAIVDACDFDALACFTWFAVQDGRTWYAVRAGLRGETSQVRMHRQILDLREGEIADHRNGNGLDNRRQNLRACNSAENNRNRGRHEASRRNRFKGVYKLRDREGFQCRIAVDGRRIFVGYFKDEIRAAHAYDRAARQYHGEFARLNFPELD